MLNDKNKKAPANLHAHHREKLRKRLQNEGPDHFEDHQLLEALLFFSIPRKDTNDTAHSLIEQTGSLSAVFSADSDVLRRIDGVGDNSITLIKLVNGIMRRIAMEDVKPRDQYNHMSKLAKYFSGLFLGVSHERSYLMLLDNDYHMLDCIYICEGTISALPVLTGKMIEKAILRQASMVVFAHNHPNGAAAPSKEDIAATHHLMAAFDLVGILFLEHIIISGNEFYPIVKHMKEADKQWESVRASRSAVVDDEEFYGDMECEMVTDFPIKRQDGLDTI